MENTTFNRSKKIPLTLVGIGTIGFLFAVFLGLIGGKVKYSNIEKVQYSALGTFHLLLLYYWVPRLRRCRHPIKADSFGFEDTSLKTGKISWDTVEDIEIKTTEYFVIKIKKFRFYLSGLSDNSLTVDVSHLTKSDQQAFHELFFHYWNKTKQPPAVL